jgi:hypothetical protein
VVVGAVGVDPKRTEVGRPVAAVAPVVLSELVAGKADEVPTCPLLAVDSVVVDETLAVDGLLRKKLVDGTTGLTGSDSAVPLALALSVLPTSADCCSCNACSKSDTLCLNSRSLLGPRPIVRAGWLSAKCFGELVTP